MVYSKSKGIQEKSDTIDVIVSLLNAGDGLETMVHVEEANH
jgi:hypothetical protein